MVPLHGKAYRPRGHRRATYANQKCTQQPNQCKQNITINLFRPLTCVSPLNYLHSRRPLDPEVLVQAGRKAFHRQSGPLYQATLVVNGTNHRTRKQHGSTTPCGIIILRGLPLEWGVGGHTENKNMTTSSPNASHHAGI